MELLVGFAEELHALLIFLHHPFYLQNAMTKLFSPKPGHLGVYSKAILERQA